MNPEFAPTEIANKKSKGKLITIAVVVIAVVLMGLATMVFVQQRNERTTPTEQRTATVTLSENGFFPASIDLTENNTLTIDNQGKDTAALYVTPVVDDDADDNFVVSGERYSVTFKDKGTYTVSAGKLEPKQLTVNVK